jgi:hypothetical protein
MKMVIKIARQAGGMTSAWLLAASLMFGATAAPVGNMTALPVVTARAKPPEPPAPPPSVPDEVNPFADEHNLTQPLKWPSAARPRIDVDVHPIQFDGLTILQMYFKGPDFEWQFDPLGEFAVTPAGAAESLAFLYQPNPVARLTFTLYAKGELLSEFTPASLVQYLAAIRIVAPKSFVLLTPIAKDATFLQPDSLAGFQAQTVDYAIVTPTEVTLHHDMFLDLNHEYILIASLTGPPALVDKLKSTLHYFLARSRVMKGLGVKEDKPGINSDASGPAAKPSNT